MNTRISIVSIGIVSMPILLKIKILKNLILLLY